MKYLESSTDQKLRKRFTNDHAHAHLRRIKLTSGSLRGLGALDLPFDFPITAIAGVNGCGKSTILALACCAFHNAKKGFHPPKRKTSYYTFRDFFVQHPEDVAPQGITIAYEIAHNNWKIDDSNTEKERIGTQFRTKPKGGKWNDYADRVKRNVIFVGIDRIVPHSERSQSRSYSRIFKDGKSEKPEGWEEKVRSAVGFVLNRTYSKFRFLEHSKYNLPIVQVGKDTYSGFNMGAGENALFEIFSLLYSCGPGALLVIDEIELGLHVEAQRKFMERLKLACWETHTQVICTTHASEIFDCLPYDARHLVEKINGKTKLNTGVSSEFAFSKLSAIPGTELDIFVEDEVAKVIIQTCLQTSARSRTTISVIGSAGAVARQLAATYLRKADQMVLAVFDGDQRAFESKNRKHANDMTEKFGTVFSDWYDARISYIPGDTWPESWLVQRAQEIIPELAPLLACQEGELGDILELGLQAGKHNEFFEIAARTGMSKQSCLQLIVSAVCQANQKLFAELVGDITDCLQQPH